MDESGTLGEYGTGSSKYFLITFLITKDPRLSIFPIRSTEKWLLKKRIKHVGGVFHANKETQETRLKMLEFSNSRDFIITSCYINQENAIGITKDRHFLYNNMVCKLLMSCIDNNIFFKGEKVIFIASRRETNKMLNIQFENHIKIALERYLDIEVELKFPKQEKGLQHVDLFSYSLFRKFELGKNDLYDKFNDHVRILEEYKIK